MRARVTALAVVSVLVVLATAGAALVAAQERLLTENLDEALDQGLVGIESALVEGQVPEVLAGFGDDDSIAQVVDADGVVVASNIDLDGARPLAPPPPPGRRTTLRTVEGVDAGSEADDGLYRLLSRRVEAPDAVFVVHVAATLEDVEESGEALVRSLVVGVPLAAAVLGVLVWLLVGRTLAPVESIRRGVAGMDGADLTRRVPEPGGDDEIARLARTMNAMLARVEGSAERQRRFVADASHELRSPLTRIRSELEVDVAHPELADLAATHASVLEETTGLQRLVEGLLHLARSDGGAPGRRHPVDLDDVVLRVAATLRAEGRVGVDTSGVGAAQVVGDAELLRRAVTNLAENAARHAAATVSLTLTTTTGADGGGTAVLAVIDDGPGIPAGQQERVFERFTRLDDSRTAATGGAGLGLAIARDIAARHGGTLVVDPDHAPGARFVLRLPLSGRP